MGAKRCYGTGMQVIIVDDDVATIDFLSPFIELKGLKYDAFSNVTDALETFARAPAQYDAAILDMCMPGMMGIELARQMREKNPNIEFLFFTGLDDRNNVRLVEQYGSYLHKPPWPDDVFNALTKLVERIAQKRNSKA